MCEKIILFVQNQPRFTFFCSRPDQIRFLSCVYFLCFILLLQVEQEFLLFLSSKKAHSHFNTAWDLQSVERVNGVMFVLGKNSQGSVKACIWKIIISWYINQLLQTNSVSVRWKKGFHEHTCAARNCKHKNGVTLKWMKKLPSMINIQGCLCLVIDFMNPCFGTWCFFDVKRNW